MDLISTNNGGGDGGNGSVGEGDEVAQNLPAREDLVWPATPRLRNEVALPDPDDPDGRLASEEYIDSPSLHPNNALGLDLLSPLGELHHLPQLPVDNDDDAHFAIDWNDVADELVGAWQALLPVLWVIIPLLWMMFELAKVLFAGLVPRFT